MKYITIVALILVSFSCKKELQNSLPDFFISSPDRVRENDTIIVPVQTEIRFRPSFRDDLDANYEGEWDFGDNTFSNEIRSSHSYDEKGVYEAHFRLRNGEIEADYKYYIKVVGQFIGKKDSGQSGFYITELNNETYLFYYGESKSIFMQKMLNFNEPFVQQKIGYGAYMIDLKVDDENNFIILSDDFFKKIDYNGSTIFRQIAGFSENGHIHITPNNEYLITGINMSYTNFVKRDNAGERLISQEIYKNADTLKYCSDAIFINNTEYFLLLQEYSYYESYTKNEITLSRRNLINDVKIDNVITDLNCSNILKVKEGFILYGFEFSNGGDLFLNLVKISPDLNKEWQRKNNMGEVYYPPTSFNDRLAIREYNDRFLFFHGNNIFIIDKSGSPILSEKYFEGISFQTNSVCPSDENSLMLATINKDDSNYMPYGDSFLMLFKIDRNGIIMN